MLDVEFPTTDGRCLVMPRYTEPENRAEDPAITNSSLCCLSSRLPRIRISPPVHPNTNQNVVETLGDPFTEIKGLPLPSIELTAKSSVRGNNIYESAFHDWTGRRTVRRACLRPDESEDGRSAARGPENSQGADQERYCYRPD